MAVDILQPWAPTRATMNKYRDVDELEVDTRRLLRWRIPLLLAVVVNFALLIRVPYSRGWVEGSSRLTNESTVSAAAVPVEPSRLPPGTHATASPAELEWIKLLTSLQAVSQARMPDLRHALARWFSWRPSWTFAAAPAPASNSGDIEEPAAVPESPTSVEPPPLDPTPAAAAPTSLTLRNAPTSGGAVVCLVNGRACELLPGEAHQFPADQSWDVRFHRGDSFGNERRNLGPGTYQFTVTDLGWELVEVADRP